MKSWKKDRNYRKFKNEDGSFTYTITVYGQDIKVDKKVYDAYSHSARQLEYIEQDLKRNRVLRDKHGKAVVDPDGRPTLLPELEVSLEKLIGEDWDYPAEEPQPEEITLKNVEKTELRRNFDVLDSDERALIKALIFDRKTERKYAAETGIPQKTINDRKTRILAKLKKLLGN